METNMPDTLALAEENLRLKEELRRSREYDTLTGLYNKNTFFQKAVELMAAHPEELFDIACVDVERFKLVNDIYGTEMGDRLLKGIAQKLKTVFTSRECILARMFNDMFALLLPGGQRQEAEQSILRIFGALSREMVLTPAIGFCPVIDRSHGTQGVSSMYDRAILALKSVKGNYLKHAATYDIDQFSLLLEEQKLLNDVSSAMENHEFEIYLQPKCNMYTGKIVGAEALVRWRHPEKGLIPPGVFIPVFERNGFIKQLDAYIWEEAARWLRRWIDAGHRPFPISVNLSRIDIFGMDVCGVLDGILQKYRLDVGLLELEITESAYVNQPEAVIQTLERLTAHKFTLLMDDFGSGYSSLNMLSSVNVDILKIDMQFLVRNDKKSKDILESVLHMSKWLDLPVIAEGVEDQWQVDFLMGLGCIYAQGYYYYRPMPLPDFEALLLEEDKLDYQDNGMLRVGREMLLDFHELFHRDIMSDRLLENVLGAIALFRMEGNRLYLSKATGEYYRLTDRLGMLSAGQGSGADLLAILRDEDRLRLLEALRHAKAVSGESGAEVSVCREAPPPARWFKLRLFHLANRIDGDIFYGALADITDQMENIERLRVRENQFYLAMEATNIVLFELDFKTKEARYSEYAQKAFNLDEVVANAPEGFIEQGTVCEESQDDFRAVYETIYAGGERASCIIHAKLGDGTLVWNRITLVAVRDEHDRAASAVGMVETVSRSAEATPEIQMELTRQKKSRRSGPPLGACATEDTETNAGCR